MLSGCIFLIGIIAMTLLLSLFNLKPAKYSTTCHCSVSLDKIIPLHLPLHYFRPYTSTKIVRVYCHNLYLANTVYVNPYSLSTSLAKYTVIPTHVIITNSLQSNIPSPFFNTHKHKSYFRFLYITPHTFQQLHY